MIIRRARLPLAALLVVALLYIPDRFPNGAHAATSVSAHAAKKNTTATWRKGKKSKKKKHRRRPVGPRLYSGVPLTIISRKSIPIAAGVTYTLESLSRNHWRVGIVHAFLDDGYDVGLFKAKDRAVGFERVADLVHRLDSTSSLHLVAAVNANYWRAGIGTVLGAAVIDGEVIGFDNIKSWARLSVRRDGSIAIAPDSLSGWIAAAYAGKIPISAVNSRLNESGIVLYNHYFGTTLPPIDTAMRGDSLMPHRGAVVDSALTRFLRDTTELFYETDEDAIGIADTLDPIPRSEEHTLKCMAIALDSPQVNAAWRCRIAAMTSHTVPILRHGIALSFPRADSSLYRRLHAGDTITIQFQSGDGSGGEIADMMMAGPRLVRNGRVSVETDAENFHRKSFINGSHARTAIGFNADQREVILVTVDRPMGTRRSGRPGIGLRDLARILVKEGASDAMNFDGGSSTTLVVDGETVVPDTGVNFSRHVASSVAIVRQRKPSTDHSR